MTDLVEARVEQTFSKPATAVFDAWLRPESVCLWLSASLKGMGLPGDIRRVEIDARVGGRFTWSDMREAGEAVHWGTYLEIERPHKLVFTWFTSAEDEAENTSVVTLAITETDTGCVATLCHRMNAAWAEYIPQTERGWGAMLAQL